ncbi:MAG: hypothetical protein JWM91_236, partial [Rhodospirillales bacterium]|nr:hypothetical protein [Rhodospirillales bacterium]
ALISFVICWKTGLSLIAYLLFLSLLFGRGLQRQRV